MCTVRPSLGHEADKEWGYRGFAPAGTKKKIAVVGGGPAGLQCAAVAAAKGHEVTLWEKNRIPGGSLHLASRAVEGGNELLRPVTYLEGACRKAGVRLMLGQECTPQILAAYHPEVAVIAAGAVFAGLPGPPASTRRT
jgi:2,4-dienoyl-CoA reductase (NADPH2)